MNLLVGGLSSLRTTLVFLHLDAGNQSCRNEDGPGPRDKAKDMTFDYWRLSTLNPDLGLDAKGQLGNGKNTGTSLPVQVNGLSNVIALAAGGSSTFALKSDGTI